MTEPSLSSTTPGRAPILGQHSSLVRANVGLVLAILILAVPGALRTLPSFRTTPAQVDFATYFLAASVLNSENPILYKDDLLAKEARNRDAQEYAPPYVYPPAFAALLRPLALLPFASAKRIWFVLNLAFLLVSVIPLVRLAGLPLHPLSIIVGLAVLALFPPLHQALDLGQVSLLLLVLCGTGLVLTMDSSGRHKQAWAGLGGILVAIGIMVKVIPGLIVPYGLLARRFGLFLGAVSGLFFFLVLGILLGGGVGNTIAYFTIALPAAYGARLSNIILDNQSFSAFFMRLLTPSTVTVALLNKDSLYTVELSRLGDNEPLALALTFMTTFAILALTAWGLIKLVGRPMTSLRWAVGFNLSLLAPMLVISTLYYHLYVLFLLPLAVLVRIGLQQRRPALWTVALVTYLLIVAQRYSNWLAVYTRSPLLVSLGLYAALLLWGSMMSLAFARIPQRHLGSA